MPVANANNMIPASAADRLIAAHDGDVALLYIYCLRTGCRDAERAAGELCRTRREIEAAMEKLERLGLLDEAKPADAKRELVPPEERLPEYTADEICRRTASDDSFGCLVKEAERLLGHVLGGGDLKMLFGLYDHLAIRPEVLLLLLNYCAEEAQASAKGDAIVRTSMNRIVREAYVWANDEILTYEQAEDYIRARRARKEGVERLRALLGISDRRMTKGEQAYLSSWLAMGFSTEVVDIAYERTVEKTGGLKWKYMDSILQSWHSRGLHEPAEIAERDPMRSPTAKPAARTPAQPRDSGGFGSLRDKIDKI